MFTKIARLFTIKTRLEALRGYLRAGRGRGEPGYLYPRSISGTGGWLLFAACTGTVFLGAARSSTRSAARGCGAQAWPGCSARARAS
jgi:hypothetical protein